MDLQVDYDTYATQYYESIEEAEENILSFLADNIHVDYIEDMDTGDTYSCNFSLKLEKI